MGVYRAFPCVQSGRVSPLRGFVVRCGAAAVALLGTAGITAFVATNPAGASGTARYVAQGGSDAANDCTSPATPCATISNAVSQSNSGDIINVAGTIDDHVTIATSLTITQWFNQAQAVIDGTNSGVPFTVNSGTVTLNRLTIQDGSNSTGNGGGIVSAGDLTLQNSIVSGNVTAAGAQGCDGNAPDCTNTTGGNGGSGGGIENTGTLTITDSTISNNTTGSGGTGGVGAGSGCAAGGSGGVGGAGAGIDNENTLTVSNSTISGNTTGQGGAGGPTSCPPATGGAGGNGGSGAGLESTGPLTVSTSTVSGNTTGQGGGGAAGQSSVPPGSGGQGGSGGDGAGLEATTADVTVSTSTFSGNTTGGGGAGGNGGNNTSGGSVLLAGGNGGNGGAGGNGSGLDNGAVTLAASTISANAVGTGGSLGTGGTGYACGGPGCEPVIPAPGAPGNKGSNGDGAGTDGATMTPLADIVANQTSGANCGSSGTVTDEGYNLTDDATGTACGFTQATDVVNANPNLGALGNNGGPTQTMLPAAGSPAIGTIPNPTTVGTTEVCPRTDQRGVPSSGACTIGAVEAIPGAAPSLPSGQNFTYTTGEFDTFSIAATGTPAPTITYPFGQPGSGKIPNGLTLSLSPGSATISGTPAANAGGTYNIKLIANNGVSPSSTQTVTLTVNQHPVMSLPPNGATVGFKAGVTSSVPWSVTAPATTWPHITQPVTYTKSGFPGGLTFNDNGNGTGTLSGTLAKGTYGPMSIKAQNVAGSSTTTFFIKAS